MGMPVVVAANGRGIPVTVSGNGFGVPCTLATNGYGVPVVQAAAGSAGMAVTGITFGPAAPAAPTLALTSPNTDTTPDFTLAGDLVVGDTVRFQYSTSSGFAGASELTNTIDAAEDSANSITFTTGALALGTWYFRARIERPVAGNSDWSNTVTDTIISGASSTTWNPADSNVNTVLSGGNLIATSGIAASALTRASQGASSGKWYCEIVLSAAISSPENIFLGIIISSAGLGANVGLAANSIGIGNAGGVYRSGAGLGTAAGSWTVGTTMCIAWDHTNKKVWLRLNGGNWNGSAGDNPATNTGGFDISSFAAGTYFIGVTLATVGDQVTAKFSPGSWSFAAPSGFVQFP